MRLDEFEVPAHSTYRHQPGGYRAGHLPSSRLEGMVNIALRRRQYTGAMIRGKLALVVPLRYLEEGGKRGF